MDRQQVQGQPGGLHWTRLTGVQLGQGISDGREVRRERVKGALMRTEGDAQALDEKQSAILHARKGVLGCVGSRCSFTELEWQRDLPKVADN